MKVSYCDGCGISESTDTQLHNLTLHPYKKAAVQWDLCGDCIVKLKEIFKDQTWRIPENE